MSDCSRRLRPNGEMGLTAAPHRGHGRIQACLPDGGKTPRPSVGEPAGLLDAALPGRPPHNEAGARTGVLVGTPEGRGLYTSLGWTTRSPMASLWYEAEADVQS